MSVLLTASLSAALPLSAASHVDVVKMRTENRVNPLGIGTSTPRFSGRLLLTGRVWCRRVIRFL